MLAEYRQSFQKVTIDETAIEDQEDYGDLLLQKAVRGELPAVVETTGVTRQDTEIWQSLGSLEDTFEALDRYLWCCM